MSSRRPNVLFVLSDQHNARCMSCAGHPDVKTPNLDRLAGEGVRFEDAHPQNPICTPSRISYLTSLYPSTHGYYGLYGREPNEPMTNMFSYFREQGYRTGALGKLHTPRYWIERDCQFIYDEFIEFPKYLESAGLYERNDNRTFRANVRNGETSTLPLEQSCEMALARQTVRFIDNEGEPRDRGDGEAPWFAWVCFSRPHGPYTPSEPFASMYPPAELTLPPTRETETEETRGRREDVSEERLRDVVSAYLGLVSQVDHGVGMILDALEERGQLEDTVIVYASDHGDYAGEHGLFEKRGGISYSAITRVPLIIRVPGQEAAGGVCDELVESVDLFPGLCEVMGLAIPKTVQGRSLKPLLDEEPQPIRESALTENAYRKTLATKRWRYVANLDGQKDELYDREEDPWELNNRIDDPACADVAQGMLRELLRRVVQARKPITSINGGWHRHTYDRDGRIDLEASGGPGHPTYNPYW